MLGGELATGTGGGAHDERHVELTAGHVQERGRRVHDLVEREQAEVHRHDLDDRTHPAERRPDPCTDEARFRQRRVADPVASEFLVQALRDGVRAAVVGDVLAHDEHPVVMGERLAQRLSHRFPIGHRRRLAHGHTSSTSSWSPEPGSPGTTGVGSSWFPEPGSPGTAGVGSTGRVT